MGNATSLRPDPQALRELEEERARHIEALGTLELTDPEGVVAECHRYLIRVDEIMRASAERQRE